MMNRAGWGYGFLALAVLLWSGNMIVGKAAMAGDVPPVALAFWRWVLALIVVAPFTARRVWRVRSVLRRHWRFFIGFGILAVGLYNVLFYVGLQHTTAIQGALIQALLPVLVVLSAWLVLRHPITARQGAGVVVSLVGAATIVVRGDFAVIGALVVNKGDLWCLAAVIAWTVQTHITKKLPQEVGLWPFLTVAMAVGVAFMTPLLIWEMATGLMMPLTPASAFFVGYTGFVASIFAFALWNAGLLRVGATRAGYFGNLFPVFSTALAVLLLGEVPAWYHYAGAALILGGIYLATVTRRPRVRTAAQAE